MSQTHYNYYAGHTLRTVEALALMPYTALDVAAALMIHPRTARRLLSSLVRDGWIETCSGERAHVTYYRTTDRLLVVALVHAAQRHGLALAPQGAKNDGHDLGD